MSDSPETKGKPIMSAEDFALKTANRRSFRDAVEMIKERDAAIEARVRAECVPPAKLYLWRNSPTEYWAFDNLYPCESLHGDPLTLGEPCGYAIVKPSVNGRLVGKK